MRHYQPGWRLAAILGLPVLAFFLLWAQFGTYGLNVAIRHGGSWWLPVSSVSTRLSPSMRAALIDPQPGNPGPLAWTALEPGFDVAELPVLVDGEPVDSLALARIDPQHFALHVRIAPAGDTGLDDWMEQVHPLLAINGSYYGRDGWPDTPLVSSGKRLGPDEYDARAGALVVTAGGAHVADLAGMRWQDALASAAEAMVSYPMLIGADGQSRVGQPSRWLANRSFVGEDGAGRIVIGTTRDAYFSLQRFSEFLIRSPLGLHTALNLDGGPVASQAVSLGAYQRRVYGTAELQMTGDSGKLLTRPYGSVPLPVLLTVDRR